MYSCHVDMPTVKSHLAASPLLFHTYTNCLLSVFLCICQAVFIPPSCLFSLCLIPASNDTQLLPRFSLLMTKSKMASIYRQPLPPAR